MHFSFWTAASTSSGSKLSTITAVAPWVTMAITPSTQAEAVEERHRQADPVRAR